MKIKTKINIEKIKKLLDPTEEIGAIEINNRVIKSLYFSNQGNLNIKSSAILPLANNTINNGYVQNEEALIKSLIEIKKILNSKRRVSPYIILSLPSQNFFSSILSIPKLADKSSFTEAVKLNLRLRSPIPLENAFLDWEHIDFNPETNNETIFTVVGDKLNINKYIYCAQKASFKIIAVEKPALGLLRFLKTYVSNISDQYLIINIDRDGIDLVVAQNDVLIFYDFSTLSEVAKYDLDNNLSNQDFIVFLNKKVGQVINFCQARQNTCLKKFFLFSIIPNIKDEIINSLTVSLGLELVPLKDDKITKITEEWYSVVGTAIRGTIPRHQDTIVSLMPTGTEKDYIQNKIINYISMWTKISITVFTALILIFYSLLNMFFQPLQISLTQQNQLISDDQKTLNAKVNKLEAQSDNFNSSVARFLNIANKKTNWENKIDFVYGLAKKHQINILNIFVSNESKNVTLQGSSPSQIVIGRFKDDLENTKNFSNITSPLESMSSDNDNYYFSIKFTLN